MPKYIDADAFVKEKREWYCSQCEKRKGMKRGKLQFVYEIGGAPCRACDVDDMISDIEDYPAADTEPVVHARWLHTKNFSGMKCSKCGARVKNGADRTHGWCYKCGAKMDGTAEGGSNR